jgi:hypothetical protein
MKSVVFVAPFFADTTLRFVGALSRVRGARVTLLTQDAPEKLPAELRGRLAAVVRVSDALREEELARTVAAVARNNRAPVDRLLGTLEELQVPLGRVRDALGIPGMGGEVAERFRDKALMKSVLRAGGVPCARHALVTSAADATSFASATGYPIIAKPPAGSGSRGTHRLTSAAELDALLRATTPSPDRPLMLEEFVVGDEFSFDAVSIDGDIVWYSINEYLPGALEVMREPWIQWCVLLPREIGDPGHAAIRPVAEQALRVLGMNTGVSHMEWFRRPDGSVAVSEVGARPPGARFTHLISWAHDFDFFAAWAGLMVHGTFEPRGRPYAAGAAYLRALGRGRVAGVTGLRATLETLGPLVVEARLPQPGQPTSDGYEGEGYVILRHPETSVVRDGLKRIIESARVVIE